MLLELSEPLLPFDLYEKILVQVKAENDEKKWGDICIKELKEKGKNPDKDR